MDGLPAVSVPLRFAQQYRKHLEALSVLNPRLRMQKQSEGMVALPVLPTCLPELNLLALQQSVAPGSACSLIYIQATLPSKKESTKSSHERLVETMQKLLTSQGEVWRTEFREDVPRSWQRHGDLALLAEGCFSLQIWNKIGPTLWETVAQEIGVKRVARKGRVSSNGFRTPGVTMLLGEDSWVTHVDNNIRYEFDVTKCMFSCGNITEKLRVASFDCRGETVVDLYAGIGYFTLPYLVHAGATYVHACEWNPDAVKALQRNLALNKVADRCTVHQGDNRQLPLLNLADRVNLGLIPSSEEGWPVACRLLKRATGGVLHIHQNVASPPRHSEPKGCVASILATELENREEVLADHCTERDVWWGWAEHTARHIAHLLCDICGTPWTTSIRHIEHVKSYAPRVNHIVLDLECRPDEALKLERAWTDIHK